MTRIPFSIVALLLCLLSFAQENIKADSRVTDYFGSEKVQIWTNQNPDSILYFNFVVNNGFKILEKSKVSSDIDLTKKQSIDLGFQLEYVTTYGQLNNFNILLLGEQFRHYEISDQYFSINNSSLVLRIPSLASFLAKFEGYKNFNKSK